MSPPGKRQRLDRFFAAHRERGLPVTTQRRAVFEAVLDRTDHPTAEQLYRAVRGQLPQISRMTGAPRHFEIDNSHNERTQYHE